MNAIETKRIAMRISIEKLAGAAGLSERGYRFCRDGLRAPGAVTIGKLNTALKRFGTGFGGEAGQLAPHAAYKSCLIVAAFYLKHDARAALGSDPARRATSDVAWMKAADVRRLALWIANGQLGFGVSDLARAAGLTKQAVSAATRGVEDDPDMDALRREIEEVFG